MTTKPINPKLGPKISHKSIFFLSSNAISVKSTLVVNIKNSSL